jgi:hypothetical protein
VAAAAVDTSPKSSLRCSHRQSGGLLLLPSLLLVVLLVVAAAALQGHTLQGATWQVVSQQAAGAGVAVAVAVVAAGAEAGAVAAAAAAQGGAAVLPQQRFLFSSSKALEAHGVRQGPATVQHGC